jgi:phage gp29-like protein
MNMNDYFHIGNPQSPMVLEAEGIKTIRNIGKQHSRRGNPNTSWLNTMTGGEYNPDKLDWKVYDKMFLDPQIRSCINFIDYAKLSKDWFVTPASTDPEDILVKEFVEHCLNNLRTPFRLVRKNMYTSLRYGYSVGEVNYTTRMWEGELRIVPDTIQPIHIGTIQNCFEYNDDNTVKNVIQRPLGGYAGEPIKIPGWKCLINSFDEIFANKYGNSGLRSVYDNYFMKRKILRWWANYLYKLEGPSVFGKSANKEELQAGLDAMREGTLSFVGEPEDQIELIESQHRGEGFMTAIEYHDHMIASNFMIGSLLLGQAGKQGGAYALGQTHLDVAQIYMDGLHEDDAIPLQEQIRTWVDFNFTVDEYPRFTFEAFTKKDLIALLNALQPYANAFLIDTKSQSWIELMRQVFHQYADIEYETEDEAEVASETVTEETPVDEIVTNEESMPDIVSAVQETLP